MGNGQLRFVSIVHIRMDWRPIVAPPKRGACNTKISHRLKRNFEHLADRLHGIVDRSARNIALASSHVRTESHPARCSGAGVRVTIGSRQHADRTVVVLHVDAHSSGPSQTRSRTGGTQHDVVASESLHVASIAGFQDANPILDGYTVFV
ncbi:hypothetical protein [Burkholderia cenocepacia]|uniref:hypothetical protein n=1 Tax=Burkholderia cenocepacia TaxID=95486 RepID=UPI002B2457B1|nr:hypothetical protein [Burkholderia cenocepacia]MEB2499187.1 hypothetical protein [Burkholderia cenocepacia]MEB2556747.1 hypothetical protein [Burkholderia cenocepacia]